MVNVTYVGHFGCQVNCVWYLVQHCVPLLDSSTWCSGCSTNLSNGSGANSSPTRLQANIHCVRDFKRRPRPRPRRRLSSQAPRRPRERMAGAFKGLPGLAPPPPLLSLEHTVGVYAPDGLAALERRARGGRELPGNGTVRVAEVGVGRKAARNLVGELDRSRRQRQEGTMRLQQSEPSLGGDGGDADTGETSSKSHLAGSRISRRWMDPETLPQRPTDDPTISDEGSASSSSGSDSDSDSGSDNDPVWCCCWSQRTRRSRRRRTGTRGPTRDRLLGSVPTTRYGAHDCNDGAISNGDWTADNLQLLDDTDDEADTNDEKLRGPPHQHTTPGDIASPRLCSVSDDPFATLAQSRHGPG